ncbi:hypothetical protein [Aneurinibacillus migulanus]|uniref:Uncharacterized protein n=1 Tax=Aneurinibacillus migulanus TaxID=47500 RepID=A0A0D1Y785_ANEMI|nr:hypothetical protein [Aneurinibacillus migulanus]KIV60313.1 hypothetical protein TS65_00605 [Aneurinibacillus migulanus]KON90487.1 hypothetical protein AF333_28810 [Aneurinibacillus migulanus]MED0894941.1 hypothetical protein [Aneurinibacillus migulanus]MED1614416.1 hypothetical protein [Aneurinibacillus migulanus]SDJ78396.1 hypothetical protein SAMN04487909_12872 [Aneurinibacillus migulanus]
MSEQLNLFGESTGVQVGSSKGAGKAERVVQSTTANKPRPGVCECGSGKFKPFLRDSLWIRKCKNELCGKETVV